MSLKRGTGSLGTGHEAIGHSSEAIAGRFEQGVVVVMGHGVVGSLSRCEDGVGC